MNAGRGVKVLGVVMAGGRNTRYGGIKAFAEVGGERVADRVIRALRAATDDVVVIANDPDAYASLALPIRRDDVATGAALAGLLTALRWSEERGCAGIITIACDMPFASGALTRYLVAVAAQGNADVVVPESGGPRGVEPLYAWYSNRCAAAIAAALDRKDLRMIGFYDDVEVVTIPIERVRSFGDPAVLFMNVNTRDELESARRLAAEGAL